MLLIFTEYSFLFSKKCFFGVPGTIYDAQTETLLAFNSPLSSQLVDAFSVLQGPPKARPSKFKIARQEEYPAVFSNSDVEVANTVLRWASEYLSLPNEQMQRTHAGLPEAVCPFVKPSIASNCFYRRGSA